MASVSASVRSWVSATAAFLLAFSGVAVIVYPVLSLLRPFFGPSASPAVPFLTFVLAFGASYPLVAGGWSLRRLGEFHVVAVVATIAWAVVLELFRFASGVGSTSPLRQAWVFALATAYVVVYRSGVELAP